MSKAITTLAVAAGAVAVAGAVAAPSIVSAWGDSNHGRDVYTIDQINNGDLGTKIVLNSITNGSIGDERNFVGAREYNAAETGQAHTWNGNTQTVENGKEYVIRLYVHNNNPGGEMAVATGTKVAFSIPTISAKSIRVNGFIKSDNAEPGEYWDYVDFTSENAFHLEYVYGSAVLENQGFAKGGVHFENDDIVTKASQGGALIGYNGFDGRVPGCFPYAEYVTIRVKAVYDTDYTIDNKVRVIGGEKVWANSVEAKIGDTVEFQIAYKNTSDKGEAQKVAIKDILPKSLQYIPETTKLWNTTFPNGGLVSPDTAMFGNGIDIGSNYVPTNTDKQNAYVRFRAKVVEEGLACGVNTLTNWAQGGVGDITIQDHASVITTKVCETPDLPSTGPEAIAGGVIAAGSIVTAAGYLIASRRALR